MHSLPDIVRAITLNNKIDESRDFAEMVQKAMVKKLAAKNAELRDLGVKQAPFVVLIGAGMPSVLAEISFVTHKQEGQLLKTPAYRQQIAEALFDAVQGYQKSLKTRSAARESSGARRANVEARRRRWPLQSAGQVVPSGVTRSASRSDAARGCTARAAA